MLPLGPKAQSLPSKFKMLASATFLSATSGAVVLRGNAVPESSRQPVHFIPLIDISDSMNDGRKLDNVKKSLEFLLPLLGSTDAVSLITFGEQAATLLPLTPASEKDTILSKIKSLHTDGCTNLSAGLMEAGAAIEPLAAARGIGSSPRSEHEPNGSTRKQGILLLTDGHANRGDSTPDGLKRIVRRLLEDHPGLTITTIGYGHDHNNSLLADIATTGGGSYNVVNNLEDVATVFGEVLGGLATVVAQNVKVTYSLGLEPTTGYAVDPASSTVNIGDLYAENEVILLFKVTDPTLARMHLTYHDMQALRSVVQDLDFEPAPAQMPKSIEIAKFRYEVSQILKEATNTVRSHRGVLPTVLKEKAEALLAQLRELAYVDEQIIQILIDDLESLLQVHDVAEATPAGLAPAALQATTSAWAQHGAYLALGRGLRTVSAQVPMPEDPAPMARHNAVHWSAAAGTPEGTPPSSPPLGAAAPGPAPPLIRTRTARVDAESSPFSNPLQQSAIRSMRQSSSQAPPPPRPRRARNAGGAPDSDSDDE